MAGVPKVVLKLAYKPGIGPINWFPGHMASAARSIRERLRVIDLVLEVRDARKWKDHFEAQKEGAVFVNAHNRDSIKLLVQEIRQHLKDLIEKRPTLLIMVVGIPNVGKSALVNAMHSLSHSAQEKLKKATVGSLPGVTQNMQGFKIGHQPNIYVLDTPGVLVPNIRDLDTGLKLALTGAIKDSVVGEERLVRLLLAMLNSRQAPLRWKKTIDEMKAKTEAEKEKVKEKSKPKTLLELKRQALLEQKKDNKRQKRERTDHNQDNFVLSLREALLTTLSNFEGNLEDDGDMDSLVETQMHELRKVLKVPMDLGDAGWIHVAKKVLNLYRIGRLGHYTLDVLPEDAEDVSS